MAFRTLSQLKHTTWETRDKAVKDLKASGLMTSGTDYVLGESKPGIWLLMDRADEDALIDQPPLSATVGKKRTLSARIKSVTAPKITKLPERAARGVKKSPQKKAVDAEKKAAKPDKEVVDVIIKVPPPPPDGADLSVLPASGVYHFMIIPTMPDAVVAEALDISQKIGTRVTIVDTKQQHVLRTLDAKVVRELRRSGRQTNGGAGATRGPRSTGKNASVVKLLFRDKGATMDQIVEVTEWKFGERYIHRLAATHNAKVVTLGDKHWRLEKSDG